MPDRSGDPLAVCIDAIYGRIRPRATALIEEATCIGCTLCIQACPVDAIVGAAKQMHTVVAAWCTGCELCLPPCPVDCIGMSPLPEDAEDPRLAADRARQRYAFHLLRSARDQREKAQRLAARMNVRHESGAAEHSGSPRRNAAQDLSLAAGAGTRRALVDAAIARARKLNAR